MALEREESPFEFTWRNFSSWFNVETAAVVTILLGAFQLLICVSLVQSDEMLPKFFFIVPLVLGVVIITGGSLAMASQKNPNKLLLRGCACSNLLGLLGSLLGFGIYIYVFNTAKNRESCEHFYYRCLPGLLEDYASSLTLQLLLYDTVTVVLHFFLSVCAFKSLKND